MEAFKENDIVEITKGEHKGESGKVTAVIPNKMRPYAPAYHEYSVDIRGVATTVEARDLKFVQRP